MSKRLTPLDTFGQGVVERGTKLGVAIFFGEQLLMRGERHHGVADFMREPVGHGLDHAQIGGFNFEPAQLLALCQIVHHEEDRGGERRILALERGDRDVED